jgi:uncharacterized protein
MPRVIAPRVNKDDEYFWTAVGQDRLVARRCEQCGYLQHPPTPMCPQCGSLEWRTQPLSGRGALYSWIVSRRPTEQDGEGDARIVGLIDLDEGIRLVSNIEADGSVLRPGLRVEVSFAEVGGVRLPQFHIATDGGM